MLVGSAFVGTFKNREMEASDHQKLHASTFPFQEKQQLKWTTFGFNSCGWRTWASRFFFLIYLLFSNVMHYA